MAHLSMSRSLPWILHNRSAEGNLLGRWRLSEVSTGSRITWSGEPSLFDKASSIGPQSPLLHDQPHSLEKTQSQRDSFPIMLKSPAAILPGVAIKVFAGLRTAELFSLDWNEVSESEIIVKGAKAKTRRECEIDVAAGGFFRTFSRGSCRPQRASPGYWRPFLASARPVESASLRINAMQTRLACPVGASAVLLCPGNGFASRLGVTAPMRHVDGRQMEPILSMPLGTHSNTDRLAKSSCFQLISFPIKRSNAFHAHRRDARSRNDARSSIAAAYGVFE